LHLHREADPAEESGYVEEDFEGYQLDPFLRCFISE